MPSSQPHQLHIVTVGTSTLLNADWKADTPLPTKKQLLKLLQNDPRKHSAELNALFPFIDRGQCTSVHLLATNTPACKLCRDALADFLQQSGVHITGVEAKDLLPASPDHASSPDAFYHGIYRFREQVFRVVRNAQQHGSRVFINVTGGLKGEIAVAALIAAELHVPAYYIHQSMTEPVFLPTAPLDAPLLDQLRRIAHATSKADKLLALEKAPRLESEALVHVTRKPDGQPSNIKLTDYAKHLLKTTTP